MTSVNQHGVSFRSPIGGTEAEGSSKDAATLPLVSPHASSVADSTSSRNSPSDAVSSYGADAEVAALRGALASARAEVAALSATVAATRAEAESRIDSLHGEAARQAGIDAHRIAELEARLAAAAAATAAPPGTPSPPPFRSSPSVLSPNSAAPRARTKAAAWEAAAIGSSVGLAAALRAWGPACLTEEDEGGNTCLHAAARAGHVDAVRDLVAAGADPMAKNKGGWTALHAAADSGTPAVVAVLLSATAAAAVPLPVGALVNAQDETGATALHYAVRYNRADVVSLLLSVPGVRPNERTKKSGWTPLHVAAYRNHRASAAILLSNSSVLSSQRDEASRAQLRLASEGVHFEDRSRIDKLEADIDTAELSKRATLERELCNVDAALERWRAERSAAAEAAACLGDDELVARHADLTGSLDAAEAQLLALPTSVVEPPHVGLILDAPSLSSAIAASGRIVAPLPVMAVDLELKSSPPFVHPGRTLRLCLVLQSATHASQSAEELGVSLGAAAAAARVAAILETPGAALPVQPLPVDVCADIPGRCVTLSCVIPIAASAESSLIISNVTVSGFALVAGIAGALAFPVRRGVHAPLRLDYAKRRDTPISMCISEAGQLFVPQYGSPDVLVFDSNRSPVERVPSAALGLSERVWWIAFADGESPSLLLADDNGNESRLVAVDPVTRTLRWATAPGLLKWCGGLAALPAHDIVIASHSDDTLFAHRLSDGSRVGRLSVRRLGVYVAADDASGAIFANGEPAPAKTGAVACFSWTPESGLKTVGAVSAAGVRESLCPLAVVPAAPGKRVSHLVVGTRYSPELVVLSLPGLVLVHTHLLAGMEVAAIAADPFGAALAVSDAAREVVWVLQWPLAGMPALE